MKTTEIKHNNIKALRNKQDFSTQIKGPDNDHMYLTMANLQVSSTDKSTGYKLNEETK